jgi:hypothetical protein
MRDIQKICVFIYFVIKFLFAMWGGGQMAKALIVTKDVKVQTPFWTCYDHDMIMTTCHGFTELVIINPKNTQNIILIINWG